MTQPVTDCFFTNTEKLKPRRELEVELEKWKRRAKAFQEGYRDKSFEVTALEIQKMDLLAHGADRVVMRQNESLKTKLLAVCIERNEAKDKFTRALELCRQKAAEWEQKSDHGTLRGYVNRSAAANELAELLERLQ